MRVLVVDDELDIAEMIARIIRHFGHSVVACGDPNDALARLEQPVDVIFCDYQMRPNGVTLLAAFEDAQPETHRVLLTGSTMTKAIREALKSGIANRLLIKPVSIADLKSALSSTN